MFWEETQAGSSVGCFSGIEMFCLYTTPAERFTGNPETQPALQKPRRTRSPNGADLVLWFQSAQLFRVSPSAAVHPGTGHL